MSTDQPNLTDGTVTLRPWRDDDLDVAVEGHDDLIAHWAGTDGSGPSRAELVDAVDGWRRGYRDGRRAAGFVVERDGRAVGHLAIRRTDAQTGRLSWALYAGHRGRGSATRALRLLTDWALTEAGQGGLGLTRVEARVEQGNEAALRVATRAGLRREGVSRVAPGAGERSETTGYVVLARLASDPPLSDPGSFRALLNSFLPRKRAISQMLVRDPADRVLLCQLTYKQDWDLPGGVVEVGESPRLAVGREVEEELSLSLPPGELLLTDWLPPWGGWDDAVCLVFDGGVQDAAIVYEVVREEREIRAAAFCSPDEVRERAADFTARRIEAALGALADGRPRYTESGR
ncbi:NUDIX hydrolase [Nocardioides donggukensis]|uniref:GNAT family N-acetyltransferase n=1 Tax=Nocardioides donggukensis TaxID=2774019 RepID=A0A927Q2X7_9ACTN|nr:GNAT family N-acetyltransferase [Nocardioides donggukensis]MBD8870061.1 GNAT family N-acetyltransferase [Nocardioides donggukensis]